MRVPVLEQRRPGGKNRIRYELKPLMENADDRVPGEVTDLLLDRLHISNEQASANAGISPKTVGYFRLPSSNPRRRRPTTEFLLQMIGSPPRQWQLLDVDRVFVLEHANMELSMALDELGFVAPLVWPETSEQT